MARLVNGQTDQHLNVVTNPAIPYPFSFSIRVKTHSTAGAIVAYGGAIGGWEVSWIQANTTAATCISGDGGNFPSATYTASISADWHLLVGVFTASNNRQIFIDSGLQTASNNAGVNPLTRPTKDFTIGGLLEAAGLIHSTAWFNGEVADAAIWNIALTADDVDALAAGRPDDVQYANLKGWWKLGSDGSLDNSAGTLPAMTVYGSCPVTADPPYVTSETYLPAIIRQTRKTYNATDADAPVRDRLTMWYPAVRPYADAWGQGFGHHHKQQITWRYDAEGIDNAWRVIPFGNADQYLQIDALPVPMYGGFAWSHWMRVYSFADYMGNYYINRVNLLTTNGTAQWMHTSYGTDYAGQFSSRCLNVAQVYNDSPPINFTAYTIPLDEWIHVTIQVKFVYGQAPGSSKLWINGRSFGTASNGIDRDAYSPDVPYRFIGPMQFGASNAGSYALKDVREYAGVITDSEAYDIYQHSLEFHQATSGLIRSDLRPVRILEKLDYVEGETGVYTLAGSAAQFSTTRKIMSSPGSFLLTGSPSTVIRSTRFLASSPGQYTFSGKTVALQLVRMLQANPGGLILEGKAATMSLARGLLAEYGIYAIDGMQADLVYRVLHAGGGRIFYVLKEDRTLRIIRDPDLEG